jgi:hypothetical protein
VAFSEFLEPVVVLTAGLQASKISFAILCVVVWGTNL